MDSLIQPSSNLIKYFPFLLTLAPLAVFWTQAKHGVLKLFRIFWKNRTINGYFSSCFYEELRKQSYVINFDDYHMTSYSTYSHRDNKELCFLYKSYNFEILLYKYVIPIFVFGMGGGRIKVQYLKFTFNFDKFLSGVCNAEWKRNTDNEQDKDKKKYSNRFYIQEFRGSSIKKIKSSSLNNGSNDNGPKGTASGGIEDEDKYIIPFYQIHSMQLNRVFGRDIKDLSLAYPQKVEKYKYQFTKQGLYALNQVQKWLDAEKWYSDRDIRYYRSILCHGKCGTGKSQLVLEIARKLDLPIFIFHLETFDDSEFLDAIKELYSYPAIILFEDIDCVWNGREGKNKEFGSLSFQTFINALSGTNSVKSKFVFTTTNNIDKLDSALIRAGRCGDEIIELESLNMEQKRKLAEIYLDKNEEIVNLVLKDSDKLSTAEFESKCVREALSLFWNK